MEREDQFIAEKFGRRTPFKVPEGYFDDFASRLMESLPPQEAVSPQEAPAIRVPMWRRARPWAAAAAGILVAVFSWQTFMLHGNRDTVQTAQPAKGDVSSAAAYSDWEAMADYTMLDTDDMYAYLEDFE